MPGRLMRLTLTVPCGEDWSPETLKEYCQHPGKRYDPTNALGPEILHELLLALRQEDRDSVHVEDAGLYP